MVLQNRCLTHLTVRCGNMEAHLGWKRSLCFRKNCCTPNSVLLPERCLVLPSCDVIWVHVVTCACRSTRPVALFRATAIQAGEVFHLFAAYPSLSRAGNLHGPPAKNLDISLTQRVCVFLLMSDREAVCSIQSIKWLFLRVKTQCVYCEVGNIF
jgi:hypothetical protein